MKTKLFVQAAATIYLVLLIFTSDLLAAPQDGSQRLTSRRRHHLAVVERKPVGVPLDGGLLALLGAAGVSYFIIRKKKKLSE
jgi:hypothetical protein